MRYKKDFALSQRGGVYYARYWVPRTGKRRGKFPRAAPQKERHIPKQNDFSAKETGVQCALMSTLKSFFKWGECKWIKRQHAKGRAFSSTQARVRRAHPDPYIFRAFGGRLLRKSRGR